MKERESGIDAQNGGEACSGKEGARESNREMEIVRRRKALPENKRYGEASRD